jgi:peptidoglycan/xylan/chitin deacetylase (PgdA/CDA1 family)
VLPLLVAPVLLTAAGHAAPALSSVPALRRRWPSRGPISVGRGRPTHVALTFDDGPDDPGTPQVLEVLADLDVRATFFVLGEMAQRHPDLVRELHTHGHEVAVHGWDHRNSLRRVSLAEGVGRTVELVTRLTGERPVHFRPPYGVVTAGALLAARRHGLRTVLWQAWGYDWQPVATAASVLARLAPDLQGGATVLLHDSDCTSSPGSWRSTLGALRPLIADLRSRGLEVGPLSQHGLR